MNNFLDFGVGSPLRTVTVESVEKISINVPSTNDAAEKICLTVKDNNNKIFKISDVWLQKNKESVIKGLWFSLSDDKELSPSSSIAQLLNYYNIKTLKDLVGKQVKVYPDDNNYLVIVACDTIKK